MITADGLKGKKIAVFGLARTGVAAVEALLASGAEVFAWDDNPDARAQLHSGLADLDALDFADLDALMMAPGVPLTFPVPHRFAVKARDAGIRIFGDFDVFEAARTALPTHKTIAITGTNGKSTTTALIHHIITSAGVPAVMGGNIGTGVLALDPLCADGVYVFEVSSYQLDLMHDFTPDVAVLLNISPDHLDRHGSMDAYVAAKAHLFELQQGMDERAVICTDDTYTRRIAASACVPVTSVSVDSDADIYFSGDWMMASGQKILDTSTVTALRGTHNKQNMAAAYGACKLVGLDDAQIVAGIMSFPGLVHRQEQVAQVGGITFINDSKATNVDATVRALGAYQNIHWIAGGHAKEGGIGDLVKSISGVKAVYLIGEAQAFFAKNLDGYVDVQCCGTLDVAFKAATDAAQKGDVVMLSPACAAFDQFDNFEVRGDAFRVLVQAYQETG